MKKIFGIFITLLLLNGISNAQNRAYTIKGGLTIGTQRWEGFERDPLFSYHGAAAIESDSEEGNLSLFAQIGYHVKGSAWRNTGFVNQSGRISFSSQKFKYKNLALVLGFKNYFSETNLGRVYYLLGLRGEYTVGTNLKDYEPINTLNGAPVYPFDEAVRKFNYGATLGSGIQIPFTEKMAGVIELSVSPDFSEQYRQAAFSANIIQNGSPVFRTFPERKIVNLVFEVSFGIRFLQKIEYEDYEDY